MRRDHPIATALAVLHTVRRQYDFVQESTPATHRYGRRASQSILPEYAMATNKEK